MEATMTNSEDRLDDFEGRIDEAALADAARLFGTTTKTDTINAALRESAARVRRTDAFDRLAERAAAGDFDELLEKRNYRHDPGRISD